MDTTARVRLVEQKDVVDSAPACGTPRLMNLLDDPKEQER